MIASGNMRMKKSYASFPRQATETCSSLSRPGSCCSVAFVGVNLFAGSADPCFRWHSSYWLPSPLYVSGPSKSNPSPFSPTPPRPPPFGPPQPGPSPLSSSSFSFPPAPAPGADPFPSRPTFCQVVAVPWRGKFKSYFNITNKLQPHLWFVATKKHTHLSTAERIIS